MIQELENYANSQKEKWGKSGLKIEIRNKEIRPKLFKLAITLESKSNVASFTVWDKGTKLPIEADTIIMDSATKKSEVTTVHPKHFQELLNAFQRLVKTMA